MMMLLLLLVMQIPETNSQSVREQWASLKQSVQVCDTPVPMNCRIHPPLTNCAHARPSALFDNDLLSYFRPHLEVSRGQKRTIVAMSAFLIIVRYCGTDGHGRLQAKFAKIATGLWALIYG